jgi:PAS domain S-box-containing protein
MSSGKDDNGNEYEAAVAALAEDRMLAGILGPNAAVLLWTPAADRILWASAPASGLRDAVADGNGRIDPSFPARPRLKSLGEGLAPRHGARLERIRFDGSRLAAPTTCACRRMTLPSGDEALMTAIIGPPPVLTPRVRGGASTASSEPAAIDAAAVESGPETGLAEATAHLTGRGTVRFLWQADASGRFLFASGVLGELVGLNGADIVGRSWDEILHDIVDDPSGEISAAIARRDTWSSRPVSWRIGRTSYAVMIDLAGMPVYGRDRQLIGFRGFGLVRTSDIVPWAVRQIRGTEPEQGGNPGLTPAPGPPPHSREAAREDARSSDDSPAATGETPTAAAENSDRTTATAEANRTRSQAGGQEAPGLEARPQTVTSVGSGNRPETSAEASFAPLNGTARARLGEAQPLLRVVEEIDAEPIETPLDLTLEPSPRPAEPEERRENAHLSRLSVAERSAFREIARALGARFEGDEPPAPANPAPMPEEASRPTSTNVTSLRPTPSVEPDAVRVLERLPVGILVHRGDTPLFANRMLLDLAGCADVEHLDAEGGVGRLFRGRSTLVSYEDGVSPFALTARTGESIPIEVRLTTVDWAGLPASLMLVRRLPENDPGQRLRALELDLRARDDQLRELSSILDTATDGVIVLDEQGRILSLNRSAEALFGYDQNEVTGEALTVLFAPESHAVASHYLDGISGNGVASLLNDGREVLGRVRQGGAIPLFMTVGRIAEGPERKYCAVLRDITAFRKAESDLMGAKRAAEDASAEKSDFLAKISHEIRTPLSTIIGFAEVMLEERFGPVGSERYKDYLQDIHASGNHVVSLVNGLLDLAKIEAGRMELAFTGVNLNELVAACVAEVQPLAARERIVMRTSFVAKLPPVVADERSIRQIMLNVVSNAIKFTEAGGQVIVSTAVTDRGEVAFRVRDTGVGMTKEEIAAALEPFRQGAAPRKRGGMGLGLPLTKALVEANRGALLITSARNEGTLVEVLFPPTRVLAD